MAYSFKRMNQAEVDEIINWHYPPPYDFYDMEADEEDLTLFLDAEYRETAHYHSVYKGEKLIGFFSFPYQQNQVEIGLGMHPAYTGNGEGLAFVKSGIEFAINNFSPKVVVLSVAVFNKRAIKVYERAGFVKTETFLQETNGSKYEFIKMKYQV